MPTIPRQAKPVEQRQAARLKRHGAKLAVADTPAKRIGAVADHLRAALAYVSPTEADRIATDVITDLRRAIMRAERAEARR